MSHGRYIYEKAAATILVWLHLAEDDLVGHTLTTVSGEIGTCTAIKLDDHHALCFTFSENPTLVFRDKLEPVRWWPVSTIKIHGPKNVATIPA